MTIVVGCTCVKADSSDQQQAEYKWKCVIAWTNSEKEEEEVYVELIREFHLRENWIPCNEDVYRREVKLIYNNPKIVSVYRKNPNAKVLEVWV
jgi:hypothetical protein